MNEGITQQTNVIQAMPEQQTAVGFYDRFTDPIQAVERLGEWFSKSGMYSCNKVEQGMVLALHCLSQRKDPLELMHSHHLIDGQLSMRADTMHAEFRRLGGKIRWKETTDEKAVAEFEFEDQKIIVEFTIQNAKRAGLIREKSGWVKNPDAMLRARVISKGVRMLCPEASRGLVSAEELGDFEPKQKMPERNVFDGDTVEGENVLPSSPAKPVTKTEATSSQPQKTAPAPSVTVSMKAEPKTGAGAKVVDVEPVKKEVEKLELTPEPATTKAPKKRKMSFIPRKKK